MKKKNVKRGIAPYLILILCVLLIYYFLAVGGSKVNDITYDKLLGEIREGNVTEVVVTQHSSEGVYVITGKLKGY